jgi:hypothetical protein
MSGVRAWEGEGGWLHVFSGCVRGEGSLSPWPAVLRGEQLNILWIKPKTFFNLKLLLSGGMGGVYARLPRRTS